MPHCVIECSNDLKNLIDFKALAKAAHDIIEESGLFLIGDIKVRISPYEHYIVNGKQDPFVHAVCHILSGRTEEKRKVLADSITKVICGFLPSVEMISVEVREINKQVYSNRKSTGIAPS